MTTPENTRPFSLELATQNHPLITRAGVPAKLIAYVPEAVEDERIITLTNNNLRFQFEDGISGGSIAFDLFLAPIGYVEGKAVFADDELYNKTTEKVCKIHASISKEVLEENYKWPSKAPVVETKLTDEEICSTFFNGGPVSKAQEYDAWRRIANKAIERAILDGDVIPTSVVKEMLEKSAKHYWEFEENKVEHSNKILKDYLEGLK